MRSYEIDLCGLLHLVESSWCGRYLWKLPYPSASCGWAQKWKDPHAPVDIHLIRWQEEEDPGGNKSDGLFSCRHTKTARHCEQLAGFVCMGSNLINMSIETAVIQLEGCLSWWAERYSGTGKKQHEFSSLCAPADMADFYLSVLSACHSNELCVPQLLFKRPRSHLAAWLGAHFLLQSRLSSLVQFIFTVLGWLKGGSSAIASAGVPSGGRWLSCLFFAKR